MRLGVIADDFTGATDIASFLVENGMSTVQVTGIPQTDYQVQGDAIVISLKSRSGSADKAVADSLAALAWLQHQGCTQFYFKYCSTFDSTAQGNIGPVTDALMDALVQQQTVICPALPINGRTVYQGYLFVMGQLLSESGMRHHPVTPMADSNLLRLMDAQSRGRSGLINSSVMDQGVDAVKSHLRSLKDEGIRYVVLDTLKDDHLLTQAEAVRDMVLVTGGSGLAIGLAQQWMKGVQHHLPATLTGAPQGKLCVVLSGSCSAMTNRQVARYVQQAPAQSIDITRCLNEPESYAKELCTWVMENISGPLAPLLYATSEPEVIQSIQRQWGAAASSEAVEHLFGTLAQSLQLQGVQRFIVAGGETSGIVAQSLGIQAFHIGPAISPGVPWVKSTDHPISLALKSGNFGDENFFARAQTEFAV
ncbi:TPA: 3-oxo-tetronate kinase [Yersinia enterocolitica]|uniref:3-oxo-tetronate kinase n=1 Tax=Yersinia enterocolitica TaxID=630 RepID=UPI0028A344B5|nr:four-carbon acid sugar kinase family protein [Yersinia enterocolitica]HDL7762148.1 four-carbon acid sugar kinase family protein [Yersinia enterocolitica]HDY4928394.1 four-carbon acid sugar kinase family protein [Yersinia enterocolitica]HEC1634907.1 four-carbon acid sugar kinase family protein [Yersinia enterocolitica]HED0387604.1 four-carbon acid sugar kinase family protein [Yersinia enterocolitica]